MRIILFTGKGGVGKSTIACATAARIAKSGKKTLLVSSDLAHNLFDIFEVGDDSGSLNLTPHLTLLEVDILKEIKDNWDAVQRYLTDFLAYLDMDRLVAEEVSLIPGMDALFLLTRILREVESDAYDVIIIDCAPTAGTLRLLTLTDSSSNKLNRILRIERTVLKLIRPLGKRIGSMKDILPDDELYVTFGAIIENIGRLGEILRTPDVSSIRLVLNPDKIAIAESKRAFTYFSLFGFPVDGVFANKLYPEEVQKGYFDHWCRMQKAQMKRLRASFLNTRIFPVKHYPAEPVGLARLEKTGGDIYAGEDPAGVLSAVNTVKFEKQTRGVVLSILLPGLDKYKLDIGRKDNDLLINTGRHMRVFHLPDTLAGKDVANAAYEKNELKIYFKEDG